MTFKTYYKRWFKTRNSNIIIVAVRNFPNINDTLEKNVKYYDIKNLQEDHKYTEIISFINLMNGCSFTPIIMGDTEPRLEKLNKYFNLGKGYQWCIAYIPKQLREGANGIAGYKRTIDIPNSNTLINWAEYLHNKNSQKFSYVCKELLQYAIRQWIYENSPENVDPNRRFQFVQNSTFNIPDNFEDIMKIIEEMKTKNWYQTIFEMFKARH